MKFAYADPPYLGCAKFYADRHPNALDFNDPETHRDLIASMCDDFPDGWALSCHEPSMYVIRAMCPADVRTAIWVKPFASFKPGVNPAYAWEPILWRGGRKRERSEPTIRNWCAVSIALRKGLVGAKPAEFCYWIFDLLNAKKGDEFADLFPGTGAFTNAWAWFNGRFTDAPLLMACPAPGPARTRRSP